MNIVIIENHNDMTVLNVDCTEDPCTQTSWDGMTIKGPSQQRYELYAIDFCGVLGFWQTPYVMDGGNGIIWNAENTMEYDLIAATHRAFARIYAGALAVSGEHFWNSMKMFPVVSRAGNENCWHFGMHACNRGENWQTMVNPFLKTWADKLLEIQVTLIYLKTDPPAPSGYLH